jgi:hypothetical protein
MNSISGFCVKGLDFCSQEENFMKGTVQWIREQGGWKTLRVIGAIAPGALLPLTVVGLFITIPATIEWYRQAKAVVLSIESTLPLDQCPINDLPTEVLGEFFKHLNLGGLLACSLVNKQWQKAITNAPQCKEKIRVLREIAFGPQHWAKFAKVSAPTDEEIQKAYLPLPQNIDEILKSQCQAFPKSEKLVRETHELVYISGKITLTNLGLILTNLGLIVESKLETGTRDVKGYQYISENIITDLDKPIDQPHWVLMTKDVLEGSRNLSYDQQQAMVQKLSETSGETHSVPKIHEAVAVAIAHLLRSNEFLFGRGNPWTHTRCEESIEGCQVVVGGFAPAGFLVSSRNGDNGRIGVAGLRRFF